MNFHTYIQAVDGQPSTKDRAISNETVGLNSTVINLILLI